jgi:putative transposase
MNRSFRFRLYPTAEQVRVLAAQLDLHRELYNAALEERREAWRMRRQSVTYIDQERQVTDVRRARPEVASCSYRALGHTLRRVDHAFKGFYRRVRSGQKAGLPRFQSAGRFDSMETSANNGAALRRHGIRWFGGGEIKAKFHRPIEGTPKTIRIKREGHRWFVIVACSEVPAKPLPKTGHDLGIDLGIRVFLARSDGEQVANPRTYERSMDELAAASRVLARGVKGSNRRRKARARLAETHRRVARRRRDFQHKTALALVRDADTIAVEDLKPARMVHANRGLSRSIHSAGWGGFLSILSDKAECAGRELVRVPPRFTSQTCAECGVRDPASREGQAFRCTACGHVADADTNAAINVLRAGAALRLQQREAVSSSPRGKGLDHDPSNHPRS